MNPVGHASGLPSKSDRRDESGFAMLLVFVLAAAIAISLYMEIPRVAFESQREREHLLIARASNTNVASSSFTANTTPTRRISTILKPPATSASFVGVTKIP